MSSKLVKEKTVIIKNIIVTVLVIAFFVGIIIVFYNMFYEEKRNSIIQDGEMSAMQAADRFDKYLSTNIDSIKLTAYTLDGMIRDHKSDEEIQEYLVGQSTAIKNAVNENSAGIYGYINGRFFSGTNWEPPEGYQPTERPWYIKPAANSGRITVLDPYLDLQSGNIMIALGKTLCDAVSVVSVDVSLDKIQAITENAVASGNSDIEIILNDKGVVVAHSDKGEVGKNYGTEQGTLGAEIVSRLDDNANCFEFTLGSSHYVVYSAELQDGWHSVSVKDATKVFSPLNFIFMLTVAVVLVVIVIISAIMMNSNRRQLTSEKVSAQLSSTADIYIALHEIDVLADTFSVVRSSSPTVAALIGNDRSNSRETIKMVMDKCSDPSTKDAILDFVDLTKLDHRLKDCNTITAEFLSTDKRWRRARFIVSGRTPSGRVARVMYLVEDIDTEKRQRDITLEAVELMNEQISSVANIYFSMYDIDLPENTFSEIKTKVQEVSDLVAGNFEHAQETIYSVMDQMSDDSTSAVIHEFVDLSTLNERLKNTNTVTEEFLSHKNVWSRARFVVSKRAADGSIEHVLWLVEGIDAEKRRRDKLTEAAETLNYRISSIANIFMTAHEIDIEEDTFTEIRSESHMVNDIIGKSRTHAQALMTKVMESVGDSSCVEDLVRFTELSSLEKRLANVNTVSIEYMNKDRLWRRGRFVVSRRGKDGKLSHVLWLVEDIDNEKKERDKLIDMSERAIAASEAKSSFLSNMSHNIRTPINAMLGMNEMILRECDDSDILSYAENVRTSGVALLGLVNDILDISKIEAGKMQITPVDYDLGVMINDLAGMTRPAAEEKGIQLILEISHSVPRMLHGDETHIRQVLMNLLSNAVKYTNAGSVTLSVDYQKAEDDPDTAILDFAVKDTGIGIKKEVVRQLLTDPDSVGSGLGITIASSLLKMMDSELRIESVYDLGSRFMFSLRQTVIDRSGIEGGGGAYTAPAEKRRKYHEKFRAPDARVLVVDDASIGLKLFRGLLKKTEVQIDTALSGDEAITLVRRNKYDIIFLDQLMPNKDGIETLREMRADRVCKCEGVPVVCLTADAVSGAREHYIAAGFDDHLTKPIDPVQLEDMLLKYLPDDKIKPPVSE